MRLCGHLRPQKRIKIAKTRGHRYFISVCGQFFHKTADNPTDLSTENRKKSPESMKKTKKERVFEGGKINV